MAQQRWTKETQAKIVARAWKDDAFRSKLLKNPREALKEFGIDVANNVECKTLQADATHFYLVLPTAPAKAKELSAQELEKMAAAGMGGIFAPLNS